MTNAILVQGLSKAYTISREHERYVALRDTLSSAAKRLLRRTKGRTRYEPKEFWALKDVSFAADPGERIGIIGRNGAGKSTLLKILSRITEPSTGRAEISGRVASLLEVGTGFHPELTGRENIVLNGAILGMTREEIRRRFDEIVEFAEIARFLETPVKRYSSGMYVRLAFAVAAHVDPDILLVDEVLAVGDQAFQKKCLERMRDLQSSGRTLIFVSHNMGAIAQLCERAIWLKGGEVAASGPSSSVIHEYLADLAHGDLIAEFDADPERRFSFLRLELVDAHDRPANTFDVLSPIRARLEYRTLGPMSGCEISLRICTADAFRVFTVNRSTTCSRQLAKGTFSATIEIPGHFLAPGDYCVDIAAHTPNVEIHEYREGAVNFTVAETGSDLAAYAGTKTGVILVRLPWHEVPITT